MRTKNDPHTGRFAKGNPGRTKGTKNTRTLQWEELGKEITEANAGRFNELMGRLWDSADVSDQLRAAELFLKMAEFFKPKLQRIQVPSGSSENIVVQFIPAEISSCGSSEFGTPLLAPAQRFDH